MHRSRFLKHKTRRLWLVLIAATLCLTSQVTAQEPSGTPEIGVIGTPVTETVCDPAATEPPDGTSAIYQIVSDQSNAQYEVEEELVNIGANTAIGKTSAFIGTIFLDDAGYPLPCSRWDVDLRTLQSDDPRRDNFLYGNTLQTETYPLATFILTSVPDLETPIQDGVETEITLIGDLTLHGVTRVVAWKATIAVTADGITGTAETGFQMPDFNILPPDTMVVISLDEHVELHIDIVATRV